MRVGSLFSGYSGLELGIRLAWPEVDVWPEWVCDIDPGACKILAHRYPSTPNLGNVADVDWSAIPPVDVMCGGFPCNDVSKIGKRLGIRPGSRSGLWTHFAYAISALRPRLVVIENVQAILSASAHSDVESCPWCVGDRGDELMRASGAVLSDLADLGYRVAWTCLRASDVGAPHERPRWFALATDANRVEVGRKYRVARGHARQERCQGPPDDRLARSGDSPSSSRPTRSHLDDWGDYAPTLARWEEASGHRAPVLTAPLPVISEWMMGLEPGWVTGVPGLSPSAQSHALGNGVVPQQAAAALTALRKVLSC